MILFMNPRQHCHRIWVHWLYRLMQILRSGGLEAVFAAVQSEHAQRVLRQNTLGHRLDVASAYLIDGVEYLLTEAVNEEQSKQFLAALHARALAQEGHDPVLVNLVHACLTVIACGGGRHNFFGVAQLIADLPEDMRQEPDWFGSHGKSSRRSSGSRSLGERVDAFVNSVADWKRRYDHV